MLIFLIHFVVCAVGQTPLWSQHLDYAIYSSAGVIKQNGGLPTYAAATWLNLPIEAEAFNSSTSGIPVWTYNQADTLVQFRVAVARHIDSYSVGRVDILVVEWAGEKNNTCVFYGFSSTDDGTPVWNYTVQACYLYLTDDIDEPIAISDDGSTAFVALLSNYSANGTLNPYQTPQLHALNAQTGARLYVYDLGPNVTLGGGHVSTTRSGDYTAWTSGSIVYVVQKNGTLRTAPINKGDGNPTTICPMGTFLTYGFMSAIIAQWNDTTGVYDKKAEYSGEGTWTLVHSATSMNGGGSQPDGCLVAFGWADYTFQQLKVEVYSMLNYKQYWQWISDKDLNDQTLPNLSFHMNYLGVASWGDHNSRTPTVFLFNLLSGVPIFNFTSPGSMFEIGVLVNNAPIPNMTMTSDEYLGTGLSAKEKLLNKEISEKNRVTADPDQIFIVTAGKAMPASEMGNGGDAYAFNLTFPH